MDGSLASLRQRFERHNGALHEILLFSTPKTAQSLSIVSEGSRYCQQDQQRVLIEFEPTLEKSGTETSDRLKERLDDEAHESIPSATDINNNSSVIVMVASLVVPFDS